MISARNLLLGVLSITAVSPSALADMNRQAAIESVAHLNNYQVVELRRYDIAPGERDRFVKYFDAYFPEAFEQLGCMVFGQFYDRSSPNKFTWLRGYKDYDARAIVDAEFYYGPVWREHRVKLNALFPGAGDNVLLLRPLTSEDDVTVLPAVDPVDETSGAKGVVVAQIFSVKKGSVDAFAKQAETIFARYRAVGIRQASVLVTLDELNNNFPQLPFRTDGPFLVWLGIVKSDKALHTQFDPLEKGGAQSLMSTGLLREKPELLVLDPTPRSRLRWWPIRDDRAKP
jgi:hypothetical protein